MLTSWYQIVHSKLRGRFPIVVNEGFWFWKSIQGTTEARKVKQGEKMPFLFRFLKKNRRNSSLTQKKPLKTVTYGYFEALASLVLQNAICNGFNGFFSLEKNFPCFSRKLNRK